MMRPNEEQKLASNSVLMVLPPLEVFLKGITGKAALDISHILDSEMLVIVVEMRSDEVFFVAWLWTQVSESAEQMKLQEAPEKRGRRVEKIWVPASYFLKKRIGTRHSHLQLIAGASQPVREKIKRKDKGTFEQTVIIDVSIFLQNEILFVELVVHSFWSKTQVRLIQKEQWQKPRGVAWQTGNDRWKKQRPGCIIFWVLGECF